jgi:hypothetical protein
MRWAMLFRLIVPFFVLLPVRAQQTSSSIPLPLDAARNLRPVTHSSLSEQYIWTAGDVTVLRPDHSHYPWNAKQKRIEPLRGRAAQSPRRTASFASLCAKRKRTNASRSRFRPASRRRRSSSSRLVPAPLFS